MHYVQLGISLAAAASFAVLTREKRERGRAQRKRSAWNLQTTALPVYCCFDYAEVSLISIYDRTGYMRL